MNARERRAGETTVAARGTEHESLLGLGLEQLSFEAERAHRLATLAAAEAKLSLQSVGVLYAGLLVAAVLLLGAWGAAIAAVAALLLSATGLPLEAILGGVAAVHVIALLGVAWVLKTAGRSIGFPETRRQLGGEA